jgi:hypothetical protein
VHAGVVRLLVRFTLIALAAAATGGCVAPLQEERLYGAPRPRDDGAPDVVAERRTGPVQLDAAMHGAELEVSVVATTECREVDVTSRVQDVSVRRSFADSSQEVNGALALLAAAGVGALQYGAEQIDCPSGSACWSAMITSEYTMLAAAAVPVGFLIYNALRVRDGRELVAAAPEIREGPWRTCSREPLAREPVYIRVPQAELSRNTDASGHAVFDLAEYAAADPNAAPVRILVRHPGSPNVVIDWPSPGPPGPPTGPVPAPSP